MIGENTLAIRVTKSVYESLYGADIGTVFYWLDKKNVGSKKLAIRDLEGFRPELKRLGISDITITKAFKLYASKPFNLQRIK
jgi:hypothetical protein